MTGSKQTEKTRPRVALVTCSALPELDDETRGLLAPLESRGVRAMPAVWNDPNIDWTGFDLAVIRSCWDYAACRGEFVRWARRVPRLANPADVLAWNTDKRYLRDMASAGIPVVPTTWIEPGQTWATPHAGEWVVKPAVSLAALDSGRYQLSDPAQHSLGLEHVRRLHEDGRAVMVQPYLSSVDTEGETSLVYLGGAFSHAVRKDAVLHGPDTGVDRRFTGEGYRIHPQQVTEEQRDFAERVLATVPGGEDRLLFARVDLIPGPRGQLLLSELELTEPNLYIGHAPGSIDRIVDAIAISVGLGRATIRASLGSGAGARG